MKKPMRFEEAMRIIDGSNTEQGLKPFRIVFCTANRAKNTGGEQIVFERAVLNAKRKKTAVEKKDTKHIRDKRYPVNVLNLTSKEIRKVNLDLIEFLNDHPII